MADTKKTIVTRVYILYACMCLFGVAITYRVFQLQFVQGDYWRSKADSLTLDYIKVDPVRGNIYTADGSLLATSVPVYDLRMDFKSGVLSSKVFDEKIDSLALCLSKLFSDKSKDAYKRELRNARREGDRYYLLKRGVSYKDLKTVRTFPIFNKGRYKGGLIVEQRNIRQKPFKELASRTVGYKIGTNTPVGLEGYFDKYLAGVSGKRLMQKLSGGVWKPVNDEDEVEARDGSDVTTTIELNIQDVASQSLLNQLQKSGAEAGCAVLMEVATGEVKAIANLKRVSDDLYREDFNYAVGYGTEPGSTFKLASLMAGIEDGYIDIDETVDCNGGRISYAPGMIMRDAHEGYKTMTIRHSFEVSSNVGISKVIKQYYQKNEQKFVDRLKKMHVGAGLELQMKGERPSRIKNTKDEDWSRVTLPYMSIGYETRLTPLQTLAFYNAVANNGKMVKPLFVKEINYRGHITDNFKPVVIADSICSQRTIKIAQELLRGVVQNGTGKNLKLPNYTIAGKTGTAQMAGAGGYRAGGKINYQASFCGYFPAENPKYSCIVVVYNPSAGGYYGAETALPVFKDIADKVFSTNLDMHKELQSDSAILAQHPVIKPGFYKDAKTSCEKLNVPYQSSETNGTWASTSRDLKGEKIKAISHSEYTVPNVTGMGLRDAIYLLETRGMQVKVIGRGSVCKQSVAAGTKINKGQLITIELS